MNSLIQLKTETKASLPRQVPATVRLQLIEGEEDKVSEKYLCRCLLSGQDYDLLIAA